MVFSGFPFLLGFLPLLLGGLAIFGRYGEIWAKTWLIAASVLFYGIGAPAFLPLLVLSVTGNFLCLRIIGASAHPGRWTAVGVALNLVVLGWFKYLHGFSPLGLSFFTFAQIGCLLQFSDGTPPPRMRDFMLFAAFFPALLAGPVLPPREMLPQFARNSAWQPTIANVATGTGFFVIGLLKKTLLADPLGDVVRNGFGHPWALTLFPAWQTAIGYALQLYFDFSGYTDMAIGVAWMCGLHFPDNFAQPYRARSIIAYWQSWHMSLTRFLMANVHAPLTMAILRRRRSNGLAIDQTAQRHVLGFVSMHGIPVVVTMLLVSLWHGATLPFLVFGLLHAAFLLINHGWRLTRAPPLPAIATIFLTQLCVLVGSVFFRATSVPAAASILAGMSGFHGIGELTLTDQALVDAAWLFGLYAIIWLTPTTRQIMCPEPNARIGWRQTPGWAVTMGFAATAGVLAAGGTGEFLYFRF